MRDINSNSSFVMTKLTLFYFFNNTELESLYFAMEAASFAIYFAMEAETFAIYFAAKRPCNLFSQKSKLGSFVLSPGLYYTSSIEWAASAMEMSAIGGRNAANLAFGHWQGGGGGKAKVSMGREGRRSDPVQKNCQGLGTCGSRLFCCCEFLKIYKCSFWPKKVFY